MNREDYKLLPLAAAGAAQGFWRYYVRPEITAKRGWVAVGALVLAHELACPPGHTLSEGVDRALEEHPVLTNLAVGVTALHLLNKLPQSVDPFHQITKLIKPPYPFS